MKIFKQIVTVILAVLMLVGPDWPLFINAAYAQPPNVNPPRTSVDLKPLVEGLLAVTSPDANDADGDGLPDSIELVIGTDPNNSDSDFDQLGDYWEVENGLDPMDPDSNFDGLPDYYEVNDVNLTDPDGDGIDNAWDFDNDGDGVNDSVDMSPFSKSVVKDTFHFDIKTQQHPTAVTFQITPKDPEHLKLFGQTWDWPYDNQGSMKDLDNSKDDVTIMPLLNLQANELPAAEEVENHGILVDGNNASVLLYPVTDQGRIVAFTGRMVYLTSAPAELSMDAKLTWKVYGKSDEKAKAFRAEDGRYVSLTEGGIAVIDQNDITPAETFRWIETGPNTVAIQAPNSKFLSAGDDGVIIADANEIGEHETFEITQIEGNKITLKAYNSKYVQVNPDATLAAASETAVNFELIDRGFLGERTLLAIYNEDFIITGLQIEESYGSEAGLFYSNDVNQTVAANLLLAYDFLKNSDNHASDMPAALASSNINVISNVQTFTDNDKAVFSLANEMLPQALDTIQEGQSLPVVTIFEDKTAGLDMAQCMSDTGDSFTADLTSQEVLTSKTLKTNWYSGGDNEPLETQDVMAKIHEIGLDEKAANALMMLTLFWNTGEQVFEDSGPTVVDPDEYQLVSDTIAQIAEGGLSALTLLYQGGTGLEALKSYKLITFVQSRGAIAIGSKQLPELAKLGNFAKFKWWVKTAGRIPKTVSAFKKLEFRLKVVDMLAALSDTGIAIYTVSTIARSTDLKDIALATALLSTTVQYFYDMMLVMIAEIPYVGWLIALGAALSDAIGNWSEDLVGWIVDLITDVVNKATANVEIVGEPWVTIEDFDGNGTDVGDRIQYEGYLKGTARCNDYHYIGVISDIYPYFKISAPSGSFSATGAPYQTEVVTGSGNRWLPITGKVNTWNTDEGWNSYEYYSGVWIEPAIAMPNFPVIIQMEVDYKLYYRWKFFVFLGFYGWWQYEISHSDGIADSGGTTFYVDVMPGSIDDFAQWRGVTPLDHDGDGVIDANEAGTNAWLYDTDGDGLNDKYEADIGTDPLRYDTDGDGLIDWFELQYDTDPMKADTDEDGLTDYLETTGWLISFNFRGETFTTRVCSDPTVPDSDGDGLNDSEEYQFKLNPRSGDTDGDGVGDKAGQTTVIVIEPVEDFNRTLALEPDAGFLSAMDVNAAGCIQVAYNPSDWGVSALVASWNAQGNRLADWAAPFVAQDDLGNWREMETKAIFALKQDNIGNVYLSVASQYESTWVVKFNSLLEQVSQYKVARHAPWCVSHLAVAESDNVYAAQQYNFSDPNVLLKFSSGLELINGWGGHEGDGPDKFDVVGGMATDRDPECLYVVEKSDVKPKRVAKFDPNGVYLTNLPTNETGELNFGDIYEGVIAAVTVDRAGYVYVADLGNNRILVFDRNTKLCAVKEVQFPATAKYFVIDVGEEGTLYVGYQWITEQGEHRINVSKWNISYAEGPMPAQPVEDNNPDRDGDGLLNDVETAGWDVTFTDANSTQTIHVTSDPLLTDTDLDGLNDLQEYEMLTNPRDPDTDNDGLSDFAERQGFSSKTNPLHFDTDGDGLPDGIEITYGSDPNSSDTDGEGLSDLQEFTLGADPNKADTDNDGLDDANEQALNTSLISPDSDGDFRFDGQEVISGTSPNNGDTDNDGISDGIESSVYGTNPANGDSDGDGLSDSNEIEMHLNPISSDTDNDGVPDGNEVEQGTNPWSGDSDNDGVPDGQDEPNNVAPDVNNAYPSKECLWPPNGKFTEIKIEGVTDPNDDPVQIAVVSITSDESSSSCGHQRFGRCGFCHWWESKPDAYVSEDGKLYIKAERNGWGNGRVYEVSFVAVDNKGGATPGKVQVKVPHYKMGGNCYSVDDGQNYEIWTSTPNSPPDVSNAHPSKEYLWPADNGFEKITIEGVTDPDGDEVRISITGVTSDEPSVSHFWDRFRCDAFISPKGDLYLRAERNRWGNGRVDEISFVAKDKKGGETAGKVQVKVPRSIQNGEVICIDDGQQYNLLQW